MSVPCRFGKEWLCSLYKKDGDKNIVQDTTCELCLKAKEIQQTSQILREALAALRTLNTYTGRLERTLARLEKPKEGQA